MEHIYLGRQPIVDRESSICAYEVLYRNKEQNSQNKDDRYASAAVINNVLNVFGTKELLGNHKAFIKIDEKFLMHDIIFTIPKEFFIFSIFSNIKLDEKTIERIENLHYKGYDLCVNDALISDIEKFAVVFDHLNYVKILVDTTDAETLKAKVTAIKEHHIKVVATKIETTEEYETAKAIGCDCFQGYFFAEPKVVENASYEPSQFHILKLYNMLLQDTNIDEITNEFETNHEVTVKLLQFINSGAFHFRKRISSIHHILVLVGRVPLAQWLMLMIYSKSVSKDDLQKPPIMLMVKYRTELMQSILKAVEPGAGSNMVGEAYFVGVLSLIDVVFGVKREKILDDMNVSDEVKAAILFDRGLLGEIFALVRDIEVFDTSAISFFEEKHKLAPNIIKNIVLQSIQDVNTFEDPTLL